MCDVVILVMCAMYWVLQYVSIDFVIVWWQSVNIHLFKNNTIEVSAYGCRPKNGRIPLIVQWYKLVHFMMRVIVLMIYA